MKENQANGRRLFWKLCQLVVLAGCLAFVSAPSRTRANSCEIYPYETCARQQQRAYDSCMAGNVVECRNPDGTINETCCSDYAFDVFYICCYP